jgi:hypothetical protein
MRGDICCWLGEVFFLYRKPHKAELFLPYFIAIFRSVPSINKQKNEENLDFYFFVTFS